MMPLTPAITDRQRLPRRFRPPHTNNTSAPADTPAPPHAYPDASPPDTPSAPTDRYCRALRRRSAENRCIAPLTRPGYQRRTSADNDLPPLQPRGGKRHLSGQALRICRSRTAAASRNHRFRDHRPRRAELGPAAACSACRCSHTSWGTGTIDKARRVPRECAECICRRCIRGQVRSLGSHRLRRLGADAGSKMGH